MSDVDNFDRINVGDVAEYTRVLTATDINGFADLTGDDNPLHMNQDYAKSSGFDGRVVHGMMTASLVSTVIGTKLPGKGALWYEQSFKFLLPVYVGQEITVRAEVTHKSQVNRIIALDVEAYDAGGRKYLTGECKVKVLPPEKKVESQMEPQKGSIIVSGSSRGIGASIAEVLAKEGYPVAVNFHQNKVNAEEVVDRILSAGGQAYPIQADIRDADAVKGMVELTAEKYGPISGVVCNASGPINAKGFLNMDWSDMQDHLDTQVQGAFNLLQASLPILLEQQSGSVVSISSIAGDNVPSAHWTAYTAAKSALGTMTKSLAGEFGPQGIRFNLVAPGMTNTDLISDIPERARKVTRMQTPLRRLADTRDIANAVKFLVGDDAKFVTGQTIRVAGGYSMG